MTLALFLDPFVRSNQQQRGAGTRGAGDHVFEKFFMTWRIDDHVRTRLRSKPDLRNINRDVLISFGLQRIHQKCPFKLHSPPAADRLDLFEFPFRQRAGVMQKPAHQSRFSVIDVAHNDNTERVSA